MYLLMLLFKLKSVLALEVCEVYEVFFMCFLHRLLITSVRC